LPDIQFPHPGISTWKTSSGARILRLHYTADPRKDSAWREREYKRTNNHALWQQEQEIDFAATEGQRVYVMDDAATIVQPRPIPKEWTRYWSLDPHPQVPHACLWCAVDPFGDRWYYREFWPSLMYGKPGRLSEDEKSPRIKDFLEVVKWLESEENPENGNTEEKIYRRVIDYAARSFGTGTSDDDPSDNFQKRFEDTGNSLGMHMIFEDARKDVGAGIERVNDGLKPREVLESGGTNYKVQSKIHIFSDLTELIYEIHNNRWQQLSALQAERTDPLGKQIQVRKHMTDNLRYIEMADPIYIAPRDKSKTWKPGTAGVNY
jgi:hypothetical protein